MEYAYIPVFWWWVEEEEEREMKLDREESRFSENERKVMEEGINEDWGLERNEEESNSKNNKR